MALAKIEQLAIYFHSHNSHIDKCFFFFPRIAFDERRNGWFTVRPVQYDNLHSYLMAREIIVIVIIRLQI